MKLFGSKKRDTEEDEDVIDAPKPVKGKKGKVKEVIPDPVPVTEDDVLAVQIAEKRAAHKEARRMQSLLGISLGFNTFFLIVILCMTYWSVAIKKDVYFAATADGRIQQLVPLDKPYISEAGLMNWVTQAITETYTMDFHNYRKTLSRAQPFYSRGAWKELLKQVEPMVNSVVDNRLMLFAVADEAPRMLAQGLYTKDLYAWKVEFPMSITHQTTEGTQTFHWLVQAVVARANVAEKQSGVEIIQFIIQPR